MQQYQYFARARDGAGVTGSIAAANQQAVIDHLRGRELTAVRVSHDSRSLISWFTRPRPAHKRTTMMLLYRSLAVLFEAGIPLRRALAILAEEIPAGEAREAIASMAGAVDGGSSLGAAMAIHPAIFSPVVIAMVQAAEQAGRLADALEQYAVALERQRSLMRRLISALAYPCFVLVSAVILCVGVLVTLLPTMATLFTQMGVALPPFVVAALAVGLALRDNALMFSAGIAAVLLVCFFLVRARLAEHADWLRLRVPVIGHIFRRVIVSRWARVLASLLHAGVGLLAALDATLPVLGSQIYATQIRRMIANVEDGGTLAQSMRNNPWFESLAVHLIAIGEETGRLDAHVLRLADLYERDVREEIDALVACIEPVMIVVVGALVGVLVISIFVPLYSLIGNVK